MGGLLELGTLQPTNLRRGRACPLPVPTRGTHHPRYDHTRQSGTEHYAAARRAGHGPPHRTFRQHLETAARKSNKRRIWPQTVGQSRVRPSSTTSHAVVIGTPSMDAYLPFFGVSSLSLRADASTMTNSRHCQPLSQSLHPLLESNTATLQPTPSSAAYSPASTTRACVTKCSRAQAGGLDGVYDEPIA